jgi:hypothetical protein
MRMLERSFDFRVQIQEADFEGLQLGPPSPPFPAIPRNPLDNWMLFPPQSMLFSTLGLTLKFERSQMVLEVHFGLIVAVVSFFAEPFPHILCFELTFCTCKDCKPGCCCRIGIHRPQCRRRN